MKTLLSLLIILVGNVSAGAAYGQARVEARPGEQVAGLWASPSGTHVAVALAGGAGTRLLIDGAEVGTADTFEAVALSDDGQYAFYFADKDGEFVATPEGTLGPFVDVRMPDVNALSAMSRPTARDSLYRCGTRSAFAARDPRGDWVVYSRYPAAPASQERAALNLHRGQTTGPDATARSNTAVRFALLKGFVPAFITTQDEEECLHIGSRKAACGAQVSLVAYSGASERLVFAIHDGESIVVHTGTRTWGPTKYVDWVTFSPDGQHLAFVMSREGLHRLVVEDVEIAAHPRIESVAFSNGRVVYLAHEADRSLLKSGSDVLAEKRFLSNLYVPVAGSVAARGGQEGTGAVLWPFEGFDALDQIWNEGFLASGDLIGQLRWKSGRQAVVRAGVASAEADGIPVFAPAPDGSQLAYVAASGGAETLVVGSKATPVADGHVESISWCTGKALVKVRMKDSECGSFAGQDQGRICCKRLVALGCAGQSVEAVCMEGGKYVHKVGGQQDREPFDDVPAVLLFADAGAGILAFAGRRGTSWFVVSQGKELAVDGKPLYVHPGDDGGWFLTPQGTGRRWVAPGFASRGCERVFAPFFLAGHSVFVQRCSGRESFVVDGKERTAHDAILTAPVAVEGGFLFLFRDGSDMQIGTETLQ